MSSGDVALVLSALNTLGVAAGAILLYRQIRTQHEWNRRKAAHDLVFRITEDLRPLRRHLESKIDIYDDAQTYATVKSQLDSESHVVLDAVLNVLENVCVAIKDGVADESLIYNSFSGILIAYWRWAGPYVKQERAKSPLLWCEITPFVGKWAQKDRERMDAIVGPRKPPL